MGRALAIAVVAAALGVTGAGLLPAQEIFWDDFEFGDLCAWSNPPVTVTLEQEAFDENTNDDYTSAEPISRCAIVEGSIGVPYDPPGPDTPIGDIDWYEFQIPGAMLLELRLERIGLASLFQPLGEIDNSSDFFFFGLFPLGEPLNDPTVASRQIYLPENGFIYADTGEGGLGTKDLPADNKWFIGIEDDRNYLDKSCPCGGQDETYRLTLAVKPVVGPGTIPLSMEPVQVPADGSPLIYRVDGGTVSSIDVIETFIDRSDPGLLDTKVYLVKKSGNSLDTIHGDDDFEFDPILGDFSHRDSRLEDLSLTAHPHFVIVDSYSKYVSGAVDLELTIQFLQPLWP